MDEKTSIEGWLLCQGSPSLWNDGAWSQTQPVKSGSSAHFLNQSIASLYLLSIAFPKLIFIMQCFGECYLISLGWTIILTNTGKCIYNIDSRPPWAVGLDSEVVWRVLEPWTWWNGWGCQGTGSKRSREVWWGCAKLRCLLSNWCLHFAFL